MSSMEFEFNPKEFLGIKWSEKVDDSGQFLSEEFLVQHSAAYKILNDEFTKVWSSDSDDDSKKNTKGKATKNVTQPVVNKDMKNDKWHTTYGGFTNFPKYSILSPQQQDVYLALMKKFTKSHSPFLSPQDQKELQIYTTLQEKVVNEQMEYSNFLREYALANQSRYLSIQPGIRKYINELWESKLKIPLKYPQFYETFRTIPLVLQDKSWKIEMHPEDTVLEVGRVNFLKSKTKTVQIPTNYAKFVQNHPIKDEDDQADTSLPKKYPVSQDKNADVIAKLKNAEFVISSSGLKRICDNHGPLFQKPWELPVTVKEYDSEDGRTKKKIIFIDKALPRKKMGVVDKIIWYHKIGIKTALVISNPNCSMKKTHPKMHKKSADGKTSNEAKPLKNADDSEGRELLAESDTKETEITSEGNECEETVDECVVTGDDEVDSSDLLDSDEGNLIIEEDSDENLSPKKVSKESENASLKPKSDVVSPVNRFIPATPESNLKKPVTRSVSKMLENLTKIEKLLGKKETNTTGKPSVARNLMAKQNSEMPEEAKSLSEEESREPTKEELTPKQLAIAKKKRKGLVRKDILDELIENQKKMFAGNDTMLEIANSDQKYLRNKSAVDFDPTPVPEGCNYVYRPFILRRKESCGGTFRTLVRCKYDATDIMDCVVARINAFTSKLIMVEDMEMKDVAKEERRLGMQVSSCLSLLYSVFRAIADIPPGQYILSHNAKLGAFANLYRAINTPRDGCYDLHKQYEIDPSVEEPQNIANLWIPIDFGIITPFHEKCSRVPGTFNPGENSKKRGKRRKKKK
ncbi:hypothetical protein J437_LFUL015525 [Ladona fulva]|uniref:Little elongation complex subunit 2 C-terminal domain-containing protein n=1 Tax=Ladona fulva TaxID=123851 RepID=A0A8K0KGD7_LADFU|nr:hypothetical protein J437_LFUL015525 [Ladona fulva]